VAKLVGCAIGAAGLSGRRRLQVGAGMIPRNEVALVVAAAGRAAGELSADVFSVLVTAVFVSTLLAPPLLRALIPPVERGPEQVPEVPPEATGTEEGAQ
jgi:Na+:H+ antiporter